MQKEFPSAAKEQYTQGPHGKPQMTEKEYAELEKQKEDSIREQTEIMNKDIPFMRLKEEYTRLQVEIYKNDVLLGKIIPDPQKHGVLGIEMLRMQVEATGWWYQFEQSQKAGAEQEKKKKEEEQKAAMEKEGTAAGSIITDGQIK